MKLQTLYTVVDNTPVSRGLILVLDRPDERHMVDQAMGAYVDGDGRIARGEFEVRLSDGYGDHYILLHSPPLRWMPRPYVIRDETGSAFWSNADGWVDIHNATRFTVADTQQLCLPTCGSWVTLWEIAGLQYARLISACESLGVFADAAVVATLAGSMDMEPAEVYGIIEEAQLHWNKFKAGV